LNYRKGQAAVDLNGAWSFADSDAAEHAGIDSVAGRHAAGLPVYPCTVPGNFELDLQAAGIIDDPFYGLNAPGRPDGAGDQLPTNN